MFHKRSDLATEQDQLGRFLPWLVAFMVFLGVLMLAGVMAVDSVVVRWDQGVSGTMTVQIAPGQDDAQNRDRLDIALRVVRSTSWVERAEALPEAKIMELLEPWLGGSEAANDLPLPMLIDVKVKTGATTDIEELSRRLSREVPGITVDDHRVWLERMVSVLKSVEMLAVAVLGLISAAMIGTVVFTTRTGLAVHRESIEVLHLIGAQDSYIARQFAWRFLGLGLKGGIIGLALALPTLYGLSWLAEGLEGSLVPNFALTPRQWAILLALPAAAALVAMLTARSTVLRTLLRMQ